MLKVRIIPCLDVKDGRVVKGVRFVDLPMPAIRSRRRKAYDAAGADELCFLDITASHENRGIILDVVRAPPRSASCRSPSAAASAPSRTSARSCSPAPTRFRSTPPRSRPPRFVREAAEKFGAQAIVVAIDAKRVCRNGDAALGDLHPWRTQRRPGSMRSPSPSEVARARRRRDPAHLDGPRRHQRRLRPGADPRHRRRRAGAGGRLRRRRHARPPRRGRPEGHASAVLAASIFHFGTYTIRQAKEHMAAAAFRCGSTARADERLHPRRPRRDHRRARPLRRPGSYTAKLARRRRRAQRQEIRRGGRRGGDRRRRRGRRGADGRGRGRALSSARRPRGARHPAGRGDGRA